MGPIFLDKRVKCRAPSLNCSREIPPEATGGGIFESFCYNLRPELDNNVISGVAIDNIGVNVHANAGDSRSNGHRYI